MHSKERLRADLKVAMKARDDVSKTAIRMVLAAIKNAEIDKRGDLDEGEALAVIQKAVKQRYETIEEAVAAGRNDLAEAEQAEATILEKYLPEQLARDEIAEHARAAIEEVGASTPKDTGNVMRVLMPKLKGQVDGKLVNEVVRELLG